MTSPLPLQISNLSVGFQKPLASNINLTVGKNEFITLMGENGCGKTTLIDCLMGVEQPLKGEVLFWGRPNFGPNRKSINEQVGWVVSQKENYPLHFSVEKLLHTIADFYPTWNWALCRKLCSSFELDTKKRLFHLSMGEQSKVRLVKAISFEPSLIILDELTANLSPSSKQSLLASILDLFASKRMSVLYVCHSSEEAIRLSDRSYEMTEAGLRLIGGQHD